MKNKTVEEVESVVESGNKTRVFYMALSPSVFIPVGHESSCELGKALASLWREDETYRGHIDEFGIIRDVMQNHLLQISSIAISLNSEDVRAEKVWSRKILSLDNIQNLMIPNLDDKTVPQAAT
ncbi:30787_t:CDS:2, partial [Gigaspora margarita]